MSEPYGREAIITDVVIPDEEDNGELEIRYTSDVLEFRLNGKLVFSGDWQGNFHTVGSSISRKAITNSSVVISRTSVAYIRPR